jgi:hypothetical protein
MKPLITPEMVRDANVKGATDSEASRGDWWACLADRLNAALEPLLAEWEAAILELAAQHQPIAEYDPERREATLACSCGYEPEAVDWKAHIMGLRTADALARHDAAVRLEEAKWWRHEIDPKWDHDPDEFGAPCPCPWCERLAALKGKP